MAGRRRQITVTSLRLLRRMRLNQVNQETIDPGQKMYMLLLFNSTGGKNFERALRVFARWETQVPP